MILAIREPGDGEDEIHALPGEQPNSIRMARADGNSISAFPVNGLRLVANDDTEAQVLLRLERVRATAYVTDCRVAVACTRYDKGGGWIGGVSSLALNAASMARAAIRSRGKTLTGQIRYAWLSDVGGHTRQDWTDEDMLVLRAHEHGSGGQITYQLLLTLPREVDAPVVAASIARRAAGYRLACGDAAGNPDDRRILEQLTAAVPLAAQGRDFGMHVFPSYWPIEERSADLGQLLR